MERAMNEARTDYWAQLQAELEQAAAKQEALQAAMLEALPVQPRSVPRLPGILPGDVTSPRDLAGASSAASTQDSVSLNESHCKPEGTLRSRASSLASTSSDYDAEYPGLGLVTVHQPEPQSLTTPSRPWRPGSQAGSMSSSVPSSPSISAACSPALTRRADVRSQSPVEEDPPDGAGRVPPFDSESRPEVQNAWQAEKGDKDKIVQDKAAMASPNGVPMRARLNLFSRGPGAGPAAMPNDNADTVSELSNPWPVAQAFQAEDASDGHSKTGESVSAVSGYSRPSSPSSVGGGMFTRLKRLRQGQLASDKPKVAFHAAGQACPSTAPATPSGALHTPTTTGKKSSWFFPTSRSKAAQDPAGRTSSLSPSATAAAAGSAAAQTAAGVVAASPRM